MTLTKRGVKGAESPALHDGDGQPPYTYISATRSLKQSLAFRAWRELVKRRCRNKQQFVVILLFQCSRTIEEMFSTTDAVEKLAEIAIDIGISLAGRLVDGYMNRKKDNDINKYLKEIGTEEIDTDDAIILIIPKKHRENSVEV